MLGRVAIHIRGAVTGQLRDVSNVMVGVIGGLAAQALYVGDWLSASILITVLVIGYAAFHILRAQSAIKSESKLIVKQLIPRMEANKEAYAKAFVPILKLMAKGWNVKDIIKLAEDKKDQATS